MYVCEYVGLQKKKDAKFTNARVESIFWVTDIALHHELQQSTHRALILTFTPPRTNSNFYSTIRAHVCYLARESWRWRLGTRN